MTPQMLLFRNRKPNTAKLLAYGFIREGDGFCHAEDIAEGQFVLTVSARKLGLDSDERMEIIDLRMKPEDVAQVVDSARYFPGYHMNKKHWITICLDGTVPMDEICERLHESYGLARK